MTDTDTSDRFVAFCRTMHRGFADLAGPAGLFWGHMANAEEFSTTHGHHSTEYHVGMAAFYARHVQAGWLTRPLPAS